MSSRQRREHERAAARFPVWLKCTESGVALQGHTANVSMGGLLLFTAGDCELPLGARVLVQFGIRSEDHGGYVLHEAPSGASVVRIERHGYGAGIAVKFGEPAVCRCKREPVLM